MSAAAKPKAPKRVRLVSATTLGDAIVPKPGLPHWYAKQTAEGMLTLLRAGELDEAMSTADALGALGEFKIGAEGARDEAAQRGIDIHSILEHHMRTGRLEDALHWKLKPEYWGYFHALTRWLLARSPEPILVEEIVCHPDNGYAGRLDLIAMIDGARTLVDLKTQERAQIFDSAHLQSALYRRASAVCGDEPVERTLIVVVARDGAHDEMECLIDDDATEAALRYYRAFRPVVSACESRNRAERAARAQPAAPGREAVKVARVESDPSTHPGAWQKHKSRVLPDGGLLEFCEAPKGWTTQKGTRRMQDFRAYYYSPPAQTSLGVAA